MADTAHVKGLDALKKALDTLPAKMEQNIMRAAMRQGMNVIRDEARNNVPVQTGELKKGLKVKTSAMKGVVTVTLKATGKHGHIANWLEYGTAAHIINPKVAKDLFFGGHFASRIDHPGIVLRPFMRPAMDTQAQAALVATGEAVKARLTKQGIETASIELEND